MKSRFFKRMFVEKIIYAGSLKLDAGSLLLYRLIFFVWGLKCMLEVYCVRLIFFNIAKINLHYPASSFLITHFYNLAGILRTKFFVLSETRPVSFCKCLFHSFGSSLEIFGVF